MTRYDMTRHFGLTLDAAGVSQPRPMRPWKVHVRRLGARGTRLPMWLVWCPCCCEWTATYSFREAREVLASILPGGVTR